MCPNCPRLGPDEMELGDTFSFTFDTPGTFEYFCQFHPMAGTIVVK